MIHLSKGLLGLSILVLIGCTAPTPPSATPLPTFTPTAVSSGTPVDDLQAAYSLTQPNERQAAVLAATRSFLNAQNLPTNDQEASALYTTIVSGVTLTPSEALIMRLGSLFVISLPDGLGLYLYNMESDSPPLLLSRWNVNLTELDIARNATELGVGYITADAVGNTQLHFALAGFRNEEWKMLWHSDQSSAWWYANRNAQIELSDDLSTLVVTGQAVNTTDAFDETGRPLYRTLRIQWRRFEQGYRIDPPREGYPSDASWHWSVSQPSAYNTLVEFVERLRAGDENGAAQLATTSTVVEAATNFGLDLPERVFAITNLEEDTVTFRDTRGAFIATMQSPVTPGEDWLISDIRPLGAPQPSEEAQP